METKFQTSFIPKKPLVQTDGPRPHRSVSVFMTISVLVFILSLAGAGFSIVWQKVLLNDQAQYQADLAKDQNQFNTDLIATLQKANTKIDIAKTLLANHLAVSQIFGIISQLTIQNVQWKSFDFSAPSSQTPGAGLTISMQGVADSFYSIAYQSDVFGKSAQFGTNKVIRNPVLSNLSVEPSGKVDFSFTATVDPAELSYMTEVSGAAASTTP